MNAGRLLSGRAAVTPNLARLDLVSLRLVSLCEQLGSLSLAANAAHLSLSGASGRIARLEQAYGTKLFIRHRRGVMPTAEGLIVARHARGVLDLVQEMNLRLAAGTGTQKAQRMKEPFLPIMESSP